MTRMMPRIMAAATALLIFMHAAATRAADFNFELLYHVAQLADQAYEGKSEVLGRLSNKTARAYTPGNSQVQYVLNFNHARKIQVVSVRGTANKVNRRLDLDIKGVRDRNLRPSEAKAET